MPRPFHPRPLSRLLPRRPAVWAVASSLAIALPGCVQGLSEGGDESSAGVGGAFDPVGVGGGFVDPLGTGGITSGIGGSLDGIGGLVDGSGGMIPIHPTCAGDVANAFNGVAPTLPGTIEAEDFDPSGYSDNSTGNEGGEYREDVDADIKQLGSGYGVGWWHASEWLEYTVTVPTAGEYDITFVGGGVEAGQTVDVSSCGTPIASDIPAPQIADWGETGMVTVSGHLDAGVQVIRVTVGDGYVDFDSLIFELTSASPGTGGSGGAGSGGAGSGGAGSGGTGTGGNTATCPLPSSFEWTSTGPLAQPAQAGWHALKDFSVTKYNGKYLVYGTVANGGWNGFFSTFTSFDEWDTAEQHYHSGHVAPTIFYFEPKDIWVLAYQWGFQYKTTKTPDVWSSWSSGQSLMSYEPDPTGGAGTGPIDQTIICDNTNCYLFFNDDAGGVYRASMPIGNFPAQFTGAQKIMQESTSLIFEGIQVYSIKGSNQYLMIIENNGTRAFRAWTATSLSGTWTPLAGANTTQSPFAGQANTTWPGGKWTTDISHGDIVRENPSEKMEIDPCNLQFLYQGKADSPGVPYGDLPYRPGLLTLVP